MKILVKLMKSYRTFSCLFGCGVLPREATPEETDVSPLPNAPSAARQLHAALKDRALQGRRSGLVEQLCYQGSVDLNSKRSFNK